MAALREQGEEDDETLTTAVEGETGLLEAVDAALAELREVEIVVAGITSEVAKLETRRDRVAAKRDRIKQHLLAAIECAGVPTPLRRPTATVSVSRGRAKVLVTDESALPAGYWRETVVHKPDLKLLAEALEVEGHVPGACMSNACPSLTIRTR